jgi:PAS domain S-box-containing protein
MLTISAGHRKPAGNIVIVDIDESSLSRFGQWPWPRYRLALLLQKIKDLGAASVGIDMLFSEADRTSPATLRSDLLRNRQINVEFKGLPEDMMDHDRIFANTLSRGPFVLGFKFFFRKQTQKPRNCLLQSLNVAWLNAPQRENASHSLFSASDVICSIDPISKSVSYGGFLNATPDIDGVLRRATLLIEYQGEFFPSLALATLMRTLGTKQVFLKKGRYGVESIHLDETIIPVDAKCNMLMNYRGKGKSFEYISAGDILNGIITKEKLKGKIVFIGSSAAGLGGYEQTPVDSVYPDVEIHATAVDNILQGDFFSRPHWATISGLSAILIVGIVSSFAIAWFGPLSNCTILAIGLLGCWYGSTWILNSYGILLSPLFPIMILVANFTALMIIKYWYNERYARKQKELALAGLKAGEARLNSVMKAIPDIVYRLDEFERITFINDAITRYGYSQDELLGTHMTDIVFPEDRQQASYRINERRTDIRATNGFEIRLLTKNPAVIPDENGVRYFLISAEGLYSTDEPQANTFVGTQGIARDITEQKKLESQLLQAQKMEAIGTLAGGIAHDFNNLLQAIQGYSQLLLYGKRREDPEYKNLKEIENAAQRAGKLTEQLLTFSRKVESKLRPVNMNQEIMQVERLLRRTIPKMIDIKLDLEEKLRIINADSAQLLQIMMNLSVNSRDAMPEGGTLGIKTKNITSDEGFLKRHVGAKQGEYVLLQFSDTGSGMDRKTMEHIFEPFYTTKEMGKGTGLGLSMVYGIVKNHGGYITCSSEMGKGTIFNIYFPAVEPIIEKEDISEDIEQEMITGRFETILLVDDEASNRNLGMEILAKSGYNVLTANDGESALEVYREKKEEISLIIVDIIMPGMGGKRCIEEIIKINPEEKVIISSGYSTNGPVGEALETHVEGLIRKPYNVRQMPKVVYEVLHRK